MALTLPSSGAGLSIVGLWLGLVVMDNEQLVRAILDVVSGSRDEALATAQVTIAVDRTQLWTDTVDSG